jgi:hypothetical protein
MGLVFKDERGATLIEAAIILPLLLFMVFSIMELGIALKDFLTTDFAAKEGARVAALAGNDPDADCLIVQSIVEGYSATDIAKLDSILIWQVNDAGNPTGMQNQWTFDNDPGDDPLDCADWNKSGAWDSTTRDVALGGGAELDIVGITIDTRHDWITGIPPWRGEMNIVRTAIQRLEPEMFET